MSKALQQVAERLAINPDELKSIVLKTVMPSNKQPTNEQFLSFIAVANEYGLNPLTKEIYAFPSQGGGIQPIVSIDGWLKIINTHPEFNGMTFTDERDSEDKLIAITCNIFRKDTQHKLPNIWRSVEEIEVSLGRSGPTGCSGTKQQFRQAGTPLVSAESSTLTRQNAIKKPM